jgi:hypothetical protein
MHGHSHNGKPTRRRRTPGLYVSGDLVLFPSWLLHAVLPAAGAEERISVAFNLGWSDGSWRWLSALEPATGMGSHSCIDNPPRRYVAPLEPGEATRQARGGRSFDDMDRDRDGFVSRAEYDNHAAHDAHGDGH